MPWLPMYVNAITAESDGEAAREAERRAMYARPDAPPLPEEPPRVPAFRRISGLARFLSRARSGAAAAR